MVDEIPDFGSPWFGISGGEPLVREDIFDVIEYAEKKYGMEVSLITSGFAFDQERLDKLAKYEVHTAVSIDGNQRIKRHNHDAKEATTKPFIAMKKLVEVGLARLLSHNHD